MGCNYSSSWLQSQSSWEHKFPYLFLSPPLCSLYLLHGSDAAPGLKTSLAHRNHLCLWNQVNHIFSTRQYLFMTGKSKNIIGTNIIKRSHKSGIRFWFVLIFDLSPIHGCWMIRKCDICPNTVLVQSEVDWFYNVESWEYLSKNY